MRGCRKICGLLVIVFALGCARELESSTGRSGDHIETPPWTAESIEADLARMASMMAMAVKKSDVQMETTNTTLSAPPALVVHDITLVASALGMDWLSKARAGWRLDFFDSEGNRIDAPEGFRLASESLHFPFAGMLPRSIQASLLENKKSSIPIFEVQSPSSGFGFTYNGEVAGLQIYCKTPSVDTVLARVRGRLGFQVPLQFANLLLPLDGSAPQVVVGNIDVQVSIIDEQNFEVIYTNWDEENWMQYSPTLEEVDASGNTICALATKGFYGTTNATGNSSLRQKVTTLALPAQIRVRFPLSFFESEVDVDLEALTEDGPPTNALARPLLQGITIEQARQGCKITMSRDEAGLAILEVLLPEVAGAEYSSAELAGLELKYGEHVADTTHECLGTYSYMVQERPFSLKTNLEDSRYRFIANPGTDVATPENVAPSKFTSAKGVVKVSLPSRFEAHFIAPPGGNVPNYRFDIRGNSVVSTIDRSIATQIPCGELPPRFTPLDSNDNPLLWMNSLPYILPEVARVYAGRIAKLRVECVAETVEIIFHVDVSAEDLEQPVIITAAE